MRKFNKAVVIDPTGLNSWAQERLRQLSGSVVFYDDIPVDDSESIRRIGDADAVFVSYRTRIGREVILACPEVRYIGMCCSLYSEESANVDIRTAGEKGICVTGIRDYGDEGVVEYVISELVRLLHGFGQHCWRGQAYELTGLKAGIIGLGRTGRMIADALRFFGAEVSYHSRTQKTDAENVGINRKTLDNLLQESDIVCTCLPRNTIILNEKEFSQLGKGKILINTSVGITFDVPALKRWVSEPGNFYLCDQVGMGGYAEELASCERVIFRNRVSGHSIQCMGRLAEKVIANAEAFLS